MRSEGFGEAVRRIQQESLVNGKPMSVRQMAIKSGVILLMRRLGKAAKVSGVRCSPHTCRHTFAVSFLRAGGHVFALRELLGHSTLTMTNRYVQLAQADLEAQHRQFSPLDRLRKRL